MKQIIFLLFITMFFCGCPSAKNEKKIIPVSNDDTDTYIDDQIYTASITDDSDLKRQEDTNIPENDTDNFIKCFDEVCASNQYCHQQKKLCVALGSDLCAPVFCQTDDECGGEKDFCVHNASGENYCSQYCDDNNRCPNEFECESVLGTENIILKQCVPKVKSCHTLGKKCSSRLSNECANPYSYCVSDYFNNTYCTKTCTTNADCPAEYKYCQPDETGMKVCQKKIGHDNTFCGVTANILDVGASCKNNSCAQYTKANTCTNDNNDIHKQFCTFSCKNNEDCGENAFCDEMQGMTGKWCVPYNCACLALSQLHDTLQPGLKLSSRNICDISHTQKEISIFYTDSFANDPLRLGIYNSLYYQPLSAHYFIESTTNRFRNSAKGVSSVSEVVILGAKFWDASIENFVNTNDNRSKDTFEKTVLSFFDSLTPKQKEQKNKTITEMSASIPETVKTSAATILSALRQAIDLRNEAIGYIGLSDTLKKKFFDNMKTMTFAVGRPLKENDKVDVSKYLESRFLFHEFSYKKMAMAAAIIASAVSKSNIDKINTSEKFEFTLHTPFGMIIIRDNDSHVYKEEEKPFQNSMLFFLDTGGDDNYEIPIGANTSINNPVSVAIDLGGKDFYGYRKFTIREDTGGERLGSDKYGRSRYKPQVTYSEQFRQGAGNLGIGMLYDFGNDSDTYQSLRFSQGYGMLGVGILYDHGGDDTYMAEAGAQGSGLLGMGILYDNKGNDTYKGYSIMQGAAQVKGIGILLDTKGDDVYHTHTGDLYQDPRTWLEQDDPLYTASLSQGSAWGRRADQPFDDIENGVFLSGGMGILSDLAGDDTYSCGAFCQGCGYWFGMGFLHDDSGNDSYDSRVYNVGSGAHFGMGIFSDNAGNDLYFQNLDQKGLSVGYGHDLTFAWMQDLGGNDRYKATGWQTFGVGSNQAIGFFIDKNGNDEYLINHYMIWGMATNRQENLAENSLRRHGRTVGIFLDEGGNDVYQRKAFFNPEYVENNKVWISPQMTGAGWSETEGYIGKVITGTTAHENAFGFGIDKE